MKGTVIVVAILLLLIPLTYAQSADDASVSVAKAETDIQEMKDLGLGTSYVTDTMKAAKSAMEEKDYALAVKKATEVSERKQRALSIRDSIRALEFRIAEVSSMGLSVENAEKSLAEAKKVFEMENYGEAEDAVFEGNSNLHGVEAEYTLLQARYRTARESIVAYISGSWAKILFALVILAVLAFVAYSRYRVVMKRRRAEDMTLEKKVLEDMMKKTQREYFNESTISKSSYEARVKKYRERMREIEEQLRAIKKLAMEE